VNAPASSESIAREATRAFRERRFAEAAAGYERLIALDPTAPAFHFNLGTARELAGDLPRAVEAYLAACRLNPKDGRLALFAGAALAATGRREEAVALFTLGDDVDPGVRHAKDNAALDPQIQRRSALADRLIREHFTRLHAAAVAEFEGSESTGELPRVRGAIWTQTHDGPVRFRTPGQQPSLFYLPDLPAPPITPRERLPWAEAVEAGTADVRDEYLEALSAGAAMTPYVDASTRGPVWQALRGNLDWSSLHLFKLGQELPLAQAFPKTLAALAAADVVRLEGRPVELFFSRLKPGAHIPPHHGIANNRITVHLPLIVPGDCEIRVGSERHAWREGELFAFDDSFEHEAWNRAGSDRVVLIFEAHHPDLGASERAAIEYAIEARGRWLRERRVPA